MLISIVNTFKQSLFLMLVGMYPSAWKAIIRYIYLFRAVMGGVEANTFAGGVTLNLMVEDVDTCYQSFQETGALFVEEITDHEWGDRAFSLLDPIGNVVYIYSPRELHDKYKEAVKE